MKTLYLSYCEVKETGDKDRLDISLPGKWEELRVADGEDVGDVAEPHLERMLGAIPDRMQAVEINGGRYMLFWLDRADTRYVVIQVVKGEVL